MKKLVCVLAVLMVCSLLVAPVSAKAPAISDNAIAQMGLADLAVVSDTQGEQVRGKGSFNFVRVRQTNVNISAFSFVVQGNSATVVVGNF